MIECKKTLKQAVRDAYLMLYGVNAEFETIEVKERVKSAYIAGLIFDDVVDEAIGAEISAFDAKMCAKAKGSQLSFDGFVFPSVLVIGDNKRIATKSALKHHVLADEDKKREALRRMQESFDYDVERNRRLMPWLDRGFTVEESVDAYIVSTRMAAAE